MSVLLACGPRRSVAADAGAVDASSTADAGSDAAGPVSNPPAMGCPAPAPGQVTDEDHPLFTGPFISVNVRPLEWLDVHGVAKAAAVAWYRKSPSGAGTNDESAQLALEGTYCNTAKVGDKGEEAMICSTRTLTGLTRERAVGVVVRGGKPVAVLDVGTGVSAMDFPGVHHLDLTLIIAPDGKSFELRERAPGGSVLVEPLSFCLERERHLDECDEAMKAGTPTDPQCPIVVAADGTRSLVRNFQAGGGFYPAALHTCTEAKVIVASMAEGAKHDPSSAREQRDGAAFVKKTCEKDLGHWAWKTDRFVH